VDVTCYLPDEIGARARAADLPFSRLLRDAVINELERREAMTETLKDMRTYEIDLVDQEDREYTGRVTGSLIAYDSNLQIQVFLTDDERVIAYNEDKREHYQMGEIDIVEGLRNLLDDDEAYADALHALGEKPVRDI